MKYSTGRMWGQAVYFAVNSSYSHDYRHTQADGSFQMFYARVMVGKYILKNNDASITMPDLLPGNLVERYDTIKGHTNGSDVFMIYANKKAYPEYLITYR